MMRQFLRLDFSTGRPTRAPIWGRPMTITCRDCDGALVTVPCFEVRESGRTTVIYLAASGGEIGRGASCSAAAHEAEKLLATLPGGYVASCDRSYAEASIPLKGNDAIGEQQLSLDGLKLQGGLF